MATRITTEHCKLAVNDTFVDDIIADIAIKLLSYGEKIAAVRLVRYQTCLGLKESKDFVDFLVDVREGYTRSYEHTADARDLASKLIHPSTY